VPLALRVRRYSVHRRILFGVTAWLLGAATATAGSLLAISLLGQGITGNSGQLLTQDAVNKALASEATEASPPDSPAAAATGKPAMPAATPAGSPSAAPATASATSAALATPPGQGQVTATATPPAAGDGTVLTSSGGEVVASCQAAGVYLISWSPLQGYEVGGVARGPAATARVTFASNVYRVTMVVSCSAGVPSATSYTRGDE
jgi:eukaryotic-like serine/threonine-protein kinase